MTEDNEETEFLPINYPEIFIGLVAPLGTDLELVKTTLGKYLTSVGYDTVLIKLTDALKEYADNALCHGHIISSLAFKGCRTVLFQARF
jgi:hypothetical protein